MKAEPDRRRVWRAPAVIALSSAAGLLSALVGDGVWDVAAWFLLGTPVLVMGWCARPRAARR